MGKQVTAYCAAALLLAITSGCKGGEDLQVVVLLVDSTAGDWTLHAGFLSEAFDDAGITYDIQYCARNDAVQRSQADLAMDDGAQVLLLAAATPRTGSFIVADAHDRERWVIDYDRLTTVGPGADAWVGFDDTAVGRLMGESLEPAIDALSLGQPQVAFVNGPSNDDSATRLAAGYHEVADPRISSGDWGLAAEVEVTDWDPAVATTRFRQVMNNSGDQVDAVFAANDDLAGAVVGVLGDRSIDPMPLSGQGATVAGLQHILAGWQTMTAYRSISAEAAVGAEAVLAVLDGTDPADLSEETFNNGENDIPFVTVTPVAVTADNIDETVVADGLRTWEEICVDEWAAFCPTEHQR